MTLENQAPVVRGIETYLGDMLAAFAFRRENPFLDVADARTLSEHFHRLRHNYRVHQQAVDAGLSSWMQDDPYQIADWLSLFTPIEAAAWTDIRGASLPLWPQLPVGRFFVDFGNPIKRVALECDGQRWHDPVKDAKRDAELQQIGWTVYRAPGWQCNALDDQPRDRTMRPIIEQIKNHFSESDL